MYCQCGCGELAPIAKLTRRGYRKGESMRFVQGHHLRLAEYKAALYTEERNAKIGAAHADGRIPPPEHFKGPAHPSWRGDGIGYAQAHTRVINERGVPTEHSCEECGHQAHEWAVHHAHPSIRFAFHGRLVKPFSTDTAAYIALCRSCHRSADRRGGYGR